MYHHTLLHSTWPHHVSPYFTPQHLTTSCITILHSTAPDHIMYHHTSLHSIWPHHVSPYFTPQHLTTSCITILHSTAPDYIMYHHTSLHSTWPHHVSPYFTPQHLTTSCITILYSTAPDYIMYHHTLLHSTWLHHVSPYFTPQHLTTSCITILHSTPPDINVLHDNSQCTDMCWIGYLIKQAWRVLAVGLYKKQLRDLCPHQPLLLPWMQGKQFINITLTSHHFPCLPFASLLFLLSCLFTPTLSLLSSVLFLQPLPFLYFLWSSLILHLYLSLVHLPSYFLYLLLHNLPLSH